MSLETSYEVLEMVRDDGVQTFRAKEKATGRGLELHLFPPFGRPENKVLFERLKNLPLESRRTFLDIGVDGSTPYVVTDPLPVVHTFKTWAEELISGPQQRAAPVATPSFTPEAPSRDDGVQILQAGQWRTGTPIPDSLISKPPAPPPPPPGRRQAPTEDYTMVFKAPFAEPVNEPPRGPSATVTLQPGEFTGLFQAPPPAAEPAAHPKAQDLPPPVGEFTGLFQPRRPTGDLTAFEPAAPTFQPAPPSPFHPAPPPPFQEAPPAAFPPAPQAAPKQEVGEFTRMFQGVPDGAPPPSKREPETPGNTEFTKFFENPLKPAPGSTPQPIIEPPPPPPASGKRAGDFTGVFGKPPVPSTGGFNVGSEPLAPLPPPPPGGGFSATGVSTPASWSQPHAQPTFASGPSEYTKMMGAPAIPTLGQTPYAQPPMAPPAPRSRTCRSSSPSGSPYCLRSRSRRF